MQSNRRRSYDWGTEVRNKKHRWPGPEVASQPRRFDTESPALAWLHEFASNHSSIPVTSEGTKELYPWLWNPNWDKTVDITLQGVKQLKGAAVEAEAMEKSLDSFLRCVKDRISRIRRTLNIVTAQSYFPLLSDDVLAMIFEFAALPFSQELGDEYDNQTPSTISRVCRRFRNITLSLPHLWRYIDVNSNLQLVASRSVNVGPILEAQVKCDVGDKKDRVIQLHSFMGRMVTQSSRISCIRFDLCPKMEEDFFKRIRRTKEFDSLSFPSLKELVLNFDDTADDFFPPHFYKEWDMPVLSTIEAHNVIPKFHSSEVYTGITKCSLKLDGIKGEGDRWQYRKVFQFVSQLSSVETLDILLHGGSLFAMYDAEATVLLPKVIHLRTAFPDADKYSVKNFFLSLRTPNKEHWVLEVKLDKWTFIQPSVDESIAKLKELDVVFHSEFEKPDCSLLKKISTLAQNLERLSVTYVAEQLRRFEVNNCKDKLPDMMDRLEEAFNENLGPESPHFILG
ncbi:hypothetical protein SCHPADRAFT_995100 [Schizopora paradoxa]|uniref:F-box domain-containing protein n=1 Tax=Schizopora paradoxa TaxID=27342 RepID=A0A0H2RWX2_9AGAM|nr:hypothetical protein SCHPADRAFT_995100 [Schizopora paradoxa]